MGDWKPMDTLPDEDGLCVLVWLPEPHFGSHIHSMRVGGVKIIGSVFHWDAGSKPTHWMHQPDGPPQTNEIKEQNAP